ncbi:MAG: CHAT domain-containing protein [Deltaproteobacteria bacterium]|nr:CHAT domain-containing protein [Deltaproteobacteria bacterium]
MNPFYNFRFRPGFTVLISFMLLFTACSKVSVPQLSNHISKKELKTAEIEEWTANPPLAKEARTATYSPIPQHPITMPKAGDTTPLGVHVTKELEVAFSSYLGGDGEKALAGLATLSDSSDDPAVLWQASFLKAQILLMMGKAAEAEEELEITSRLEIDRFGSDLNALALKGEVKIWLEDYDSALKDFAQIVKTIGTWELPIKFASFPTNRVSLYYLTTAKLRAYTGIAGVYIFKEDYLKALTWSREAERLYNNSHFVVNHPLYGMNDEVHADNYYGRAMNLTFLASATLAISQDINASEKLFQQADGFYTALGYSVGQITVAALKARIFNRLGLHDLCYDAGQHAIRLAIDRGMPDYVWRVGILTGITLLAKGLTDQAEHAFRQAQNGVEAISGNLSTDKAKIRFGVGKADIVYHLARIDIQKKDWPLLFSDLERARARAFVELLSNQALDKKREAGLISEIKTLEAQILKQRLVNMAPGAHDPADIEKEKSLLKTREGKILLLKEKDPELAELISIRQARLSTVQSALKPGETMAYAVPGKANDAVQFLMITSDSASVKKLQVTNKNISQLVENFAIAFELGELNRGIQLKSKKSYSAESVTHESVVRDIKEAFAISQWQVQEKLYLVPSGDLYFIPWGVLETPFPIVTLPTGNWINRKPQPLKRKNDIVVIGDPDFGGELPQLPGAKKEAITVGKIYAHEPLIGNQAQEKNLRTRVGQGVGIIHLATHGIFDSKNPLQSAIFLTANGKADPLTASEIYETPLPAKLVILSACETGLGKTIAGDDLLGLTRSFYLGGAVSTLSSLWQIEDEGTMEFMKKFHQQAVNGDYGTAWVQARDYVKQLGYPASVYGAFVLGGASM